MAFGYAGNCEEWDTTRKRIKDKLDDIDRRIIDITESWANCDIT